ncbi:MAG: SDR family oxidoreductase [Bacteroidales bacterium]
MLHKKVALVTGGSGGIGSFIVNSLCDEGYTVAMQYSSNKQHAENIRNNRENIHLFCSNFLSEDLTLIEEVVEQLGRIDCLINCAGILADTSLFDLSAKDFDTHFAINTRAPYLLSARAFEYMKKQNYGRIVNISSIAVKYGMGRGQGVQYAGSKAALEALTTGLSRIGAHYNILVNTIRPGVIMTEMQKGRPDLKKRIELVPVQRIGTPQEIADMTVYLCSDKANFITGETITIAGGE